MISLPNIPNINDTPAIIPPFLTSTPSGSDLTQQALNDLLNGLGNPGGPTNPLSTGTGGNATAVAQSNPTIIIEPKASDSILPYVLIGLGVLAIVAFVVLEKGGRGGHGGGGKHHHSGGHHGSHK